MAIRGETQCLWPYIDRTQVSGQCKFRRSATDISVRLTNNLYTGVDVADNLEGYVLSHISGQCRFSNFFKGGISFLRMLLIV